MAPRPRRPRPRPGRPARRPLALLRRGAAGERRGRSSPPDRARVHAMSAKEGRFGPGRLALAVGLVAIGFLALRTAVDSDYGWHLANGRHLFDGVLFGGVDVYSWTAGGAPGGGHEWVPRGGMDAPDDCVRR